MKGCATIEGLPFFNKVSLRGMASLVQLMGYAVEVHLIARKKSGSRSTPPGSRKVFDSHGCRVGIVMAIWSSRYGLDGAFVDREAWIAAELAKGSHAAGHQHAIPSS